MTDDFKDTKSFNWKGNKEDEPEFSRCVKILLRIKEDEDEEEEPESDTKDTKDSKDKDKDKD